MLNNLFLGKPKTHFWFANKSINVKKGIPEPCPLKMIIKSFEKIKIVVYKYGFYFAMIQWMFLLVPVVR